MYLGCPTDEEILVPAEQEESNADPYALRFGQIEASKYLMSIQHIFELKNRPSVLVNDNELAGYCDTAKLFGPLGVFFLYGRRLIPGEPEKIPTFENSQQNSTSQI